MSLVLFNLAIRQLFIQPMTYPYSKKSSLFFTVFFTGIILISIPFLVKSINNKDNVYWLISLWDLPYILMLIYIILKQLIPAFTNKPALEINVDGITSFVKNVSISWSDIENIDLKSGKTSAALYITFKWETDHGNYIRIPLGFVAGSDDEIYDTAIKRFKVKGERLKQIKLMIVI